MSEEPEKLEPGLYVVGTPIGHLGDISARALETLRQADAILAEDTRHTHKLLSRFEIRTPMISCHAFNEAARAKPVLERIQNGEVLALVTDSGMPGVSDPGARVVAACRAAGLPVYIVPGPSAVTAAVALSGMGGGGFLFYGFLPVKSAARRRILADLLQSPYPVVLYESPHRIQKLLDELCDLAADRSVFVGRELTKKFEQSLVDTPAQLKAYFATHSIKGEWVVMIAPADQA